MAQLGSLENESECAELLENLEKNTEQIEKYDALQSQKEITRLRKLQSVYRQ